MRRIDTIVGNRNDDPDLDARIEAHKESGTLERLFIEAKERKKSRLRVETDAGTDLGIVVDRPELRSGDVLFIEEQAAGIVTFEMREAYIVELPDPDTEVVALAVKLGHRIGNQHWDIAVEDGSVYVPVEADKQVLEDVLGPYLPSEATTRYESVDAELFIGGPESDHSGADHEHSHRADDHHGNHKHSHD